MHIDDIERTDSRLAALGRGLGAMRLRIGEGLIRLEAQSGLRVLGFPSLDAYAREALGRSGRWAADARALARRLSHLPHLRSSLLSGRLSTSMVELVCRVATPDDDAEWVERACHMTVRALRVHLRSERLADLEDDTSAPRATITTTVDRIDALAFERARVMVEALGAPRGEGAIEAMLAEGLGEILAAHPDVDLPSTLVGEPDATRAERAELALLRERREAANESAVPTEDLVPTAPALGDTPIDLIEGDVATIDAALRATARELARRDLELGALARWAADHELWRALRFTSFDHYCRDRIGLSPSSIATRVALSRRLESLSEIETALTSGRIGYEGAALVARVAGHDNVGAWVARAEVRTVKHLREEVEATELVARVEGRDPRRLGPPDDTMLAEVHDIERAAMAVVGAGGQMSGGHDLAWPTPVDLPRTRLHLSLSDDVARFWQSLERLHGQLAPEPGASFVAFLVRAVTKSWAGSLPEVAYRHIYQRDRWRCASPVCRSRNVTPHHIRFRSRGGGEDSGNLVAVCEVCHLGLVHEGYLNVSGDADGELAWEAPGWQVHGRRRTTRLEMLERPRV